MEFLSFLNAFMSTSTLGSSPSSPIANMDSEMVDVSSSSPTSNPLDTVAHLDPTIAAVALVLTHPNTTPTDAAAIKQFKSHPIRAGTYQINNGANLATFLLCGRLAGHNTDRMPPYFNLSAPGDTVSPIDINQLKKWRARFSVEPLTVLSAYAGTSSRIVKRSNINFERAKAILSTAWSDVPRSSQGQMYYYGSKDSNDRWQLMLITPVLFDLTSPSAMPPVMTAEEIAAIGADDIEEDTEEVDPIELRLFEFINQREQPKPANGQWFLSQMPDDYHKYEELAKNHDLLKYRLNLPNVFDKDGHRIHPSDYKTALTVGTKVAVKFHNMIYKFASCTGQSLLTDLFILPDTPEQLQTFYRAIFKNLPPPSTLSAVIAPYANPSPTKRAREADDNTGESTVASG
ncbi:hypothetical protein D9758_012511 [Tetrapyrgos nigripes]|uniref:Uncharacterized protein n=1 Tax=Tetrapyrgos nigripes TaxID=182062 RepID=A0A8H5G3B1_9AGAR|nr:hypothetical protein D9758_012511 [Tetrapyrgos nigripes]